jgi:hypothetical protein
MSNFEKMTVVQLKEYAKDNGVDLDGAKTKTSILSILVGIGSTAGESENKSVISSEITSPKAKAVKSPIKVDDMGIITTATADNFKDKIFSSKPKIEEVKKVAIYSEKNMNWNSIGRISKGYNIVTKEAADMWLTRKGIREAEPEEVATHYGL